MWADQHGDGPGTSTGSGIASGIHSYVGAHSQGEPSVPSRRLDPVDRVEEGSGATIAGVCAVHSLHVGVARLREKLH